MSTELMANNAHHSQKMEAFCQQHKFSGWFETSAKENINIDEAAAALVKKVILFSTE